MPTDDEGTRVTRATRKRLGSIDIDPAPSPSTPKKAAAVRKGADQLPAIAESDAKIPENVPKINGTPKVTRTRKSVSESVDTPTTGTNSSTPLTGLRRKPGEVSEPASTPGRRVTRRTSTTETFEELHLPVRRVTRRTSNASEDAGHTASPALATRGKQRMSIVVAPTDATLIEEAEEPLNERSDSPAENTRSRVRALSHSPYNSGTDSKNTSAKESDVTVALAQDLKVNLEEAFNYEGPVAAKSVSFDKDTAGNEADDDKTSKTKFAKTPKTVKNLSYTGNSTVEVSKMMNSTSENDMSQKGDSSVATEDLDKSLEQLAQDIQNKGLPIADESIMSSVQSPKVGKKDVCPVTPRPTVAKLQSISSSTPIVKATPATGSPKKAVIPLVGKVVAEATPIEEKKLDTSKTRELNATFAGKSSPKKQVVANRSWSHSVHGSSDKKIDAFGSTPDSPAKPVTVAEDKKAKRKSIPRVVSSDEEDDDNSSNFEDDECEVAPDDYQSGDSMNESEREEMEDNEIVDDGESIGSDDSAGAADADFDEYDRNSFLATDEEVDDEELLDGTGDDLSLASESKTSPKKRNSRKLPASDVSMDSSIDSCEVQKKSLKKGGRIVRNPVDDSSSEDDEAQTEELNDNELEIVKRFQNTVSELASKLKSPGTTPKKPEESSRKSIKAPEEDVPESSKKTRKSSVSQAEPQAVEEKADKPEQTSEETTADQTQKTRKSSTTQDDQTEKEKMSPKKQTKPIEGEKDESVAITKSPRKSLKGPEEDVSKSAKKSRKSSVGQIENEINQATAGEELAKSPRKSLKQTEDKSPKKASNTEEKTDSQNNAKSPPKSAKKPEKADHEQDEQDSEDAASDEEDSDGEDEENGDESGSGEETSDDDYDDIVEDMEDIEDSDEEPKKKKKQTNTNKIDEKPTNMFGIKEQRLHVLLQKCHEYVGTKKDELEEKKKLTKGAREAKRQERLKRREEEAARKQAQEAEEGRTVIKKKKKRKPKQKNPELGDDESNANKELPAIVKKKMEVLEKRRQRNREKKAARKKKQMGTDTTQSNSSNAEVSPTKKAATSPKSEKKAKKKDKQANDTSLQLQNLPTHISMAALNMQLKAAAKAEVEAKKAEKQLENPVKVDAPKLIEDTSNAPVPKKKKHQDNQEQDTVTKPIQTEAEDTSSSSVPKKKKRQILDIVEQTLKQDKQEQSSAKPPPPKKRLNILDESGAFSTAQFDVVPVTPEAKLLKQNSGFKEAPITPEPINFKVTSIIPKHQPAPTKSKGGFKEAMRKKLANIQEVDHKMPLPKWKLKPTSSGEFVVTKTKQEAGDFIPLSTEGSTTQFAVATLDSMPATNGGGNKKRKSGNAAPVAASNAQKFKENAIMGTAQRESMKAKFRKIDKKKANRAGFSF